MSDQNNIESAVLKLESLDKEFSLVMTEYKEAYANYITNLNSSSSEKKYVSLKGRTYWGTTGISEEGASTSEECQARCSLDSKCTGATFNASKAYCWIRGGDGSLTPGLEDDYAIVPEIQQNITTLKFLNLRLLSLHSQINNTLEAVKPSYDSTVNTNTLKHADLNSVYEQLLAERSQIEKLLQNYETLDQTENDSALEVNQEQSYYRLFLCIVVILSYFLFNVVVLDNYNVLNVELVLIIALYILFPANVAVVSIFTFFYLLIKNVFFSK